jgi:squalene-hopene/tetraprenyl-beta-curcumene cyclase
LTALLERLQPANGGFLEAVPLTAFVVMSLAASGLASHDVVQRGVRFLTSVVRGDGSWPMDTNLATWVTTLAVDALAAGDLGASLSRPRQAAVLGWLLGQQHAEPHPYTMADPGGWAWTDLPGGVPDADDTAGALRALRFLCLPAGQQVEQAASRGLVWLLNLQNRDGGMPTFCRGWGRLPFDRSCPDITAHALQAFDAWRDHTAPGLQRRIDRAAGRALRYLAGCRSPDGSWLPLWFGNQHAPGAGSPTYGTARVVIALGTLARPEWGDTAPLTAGGRRWLLDARNPDGGWGGAPGVASSVEETALAVRALARGTRAALEGAWCGARWLCEHTYEGERFGPSPIGLYFAALWYAESLYPVVHTVAALAELSRKDERSETG